MLHLIEPALGRVSGGLRYNQAVLDAARGRITRHTLPGAWPDPTDDDVAALQRLLAELDGPALIDGLIGCSPATPVKADVPIVQLVHALADTPHAQRRERANLRAADAVIATSQFAASALWQRYDLEVTVARPGVGRRPQAVGSDDGSSFLCVGGIEPNKNQTFLAAVFTRLLQQRTTQWRCTLAGPVTDVEYAGRLERQLAALSEAQVRVVGELDEQALAATYATTDLLLLPSRAETFGLVVQEAAAAGIPAFVTAGTGAEEALCAGEALALSEQLWAQRLEQWLTDRDYRRQLQATARTARTQLTTGWDKTAGIILAVLDDLAV